MSLWRGGWIHSSFPLHGYDPALGNWSATKGQASPSAKPPYNLFVPLCLRSAVLQWARCSRVAWHPKNMERSPTFLVGQPGWGHLWFCQCLFCLLSTKGYHQALDVFLSPSSTSLPFLTGNNMVMPSVIDGFSKMAHFVQLPKLPSTKEMAQLILHHVFCLCCNRVDIVLQSARGQTIFPLVPQSVQCSNRMQEAGDGDGSSVFGFTEFFLVIGTVEYPQSSYQFCDRTVTVSTLEKGNFYPWQ